MHVLAGSSYYDNVRPLAYPDSDAVLICFDISRPETLDSVLKKVSQSSTTHCHPLTDHASLISLSLSLLPSCYQWSWALPEEACHVVHVRAIAAGPVANRSRVQLAQA